MPTSNNPGHGLRRTPRLLLAGALFVLLSVFVVARFEITADITHFLPDAENRALATISKQITESEISRTLVLAIETPGLSVSVAASRDFEGRLREDPRVAAAIEFLEGGPAEDIDRTLFELYEPRRLGFLASNAPAALDRISEAGLREAARRLREELAGPLSSLTARVAARDPFLTIPTLFRSLENARAGGLTVAEGRFVTEDGTTAVLFLGTKASALDARAQAPLLAAIEEQFARTNEVFGESIRLEQSGVHRMATRTAQTIEADIKRVSRVSTLALMLLLFVLFRSFRFIALAAIPVLFGILGGSAFVLLVFGRLHAITLAFGAALIGVSIDYVVHLYCHDTIVAPEGGPRASLEAIRRPLVTGAVTTLAGFLSLSASSLSGLREIACFSVVGLAAAFAASIWIVPVLMSPERVSVEARDRWVEALTRSFERVGRHRVFLAGLPLAAFLVMCWGLPQLRFNPDLASLGNMDAEIQAEDERVRAKVMRFEQSRFVIALGEDDAQALEAHGLVARQLDAAVESGELGAHRGVAMLLPSPETQRAVSSLVRSDAELPARFGRVFEEEGFASNAFAPFLASLGEPGVAPLTYDDLAGSQAAALVRPFRIHLGDRIAYLSFLHDVKRPEAIAARLEGLSDTLFLRQSDLWKEAQLQYQTSTAKLLTGGLLAVLALLAGRYRETRRTLVAFVPSLLAAGVTISVLALSGRGLDLISLTALLFVVSMGVDYSVFLTDADADGAGGQVDGGDSNHEGVADGASRKNAPDERTRAKCRAAALTGALLAGSSTVLAFGLLALSPHPVLSGLGLTAAVGIAASLVLAPTVLLLVRPNSSERTRVR